jgi:hypothetical protein
MSRVHHGVTLRFRTMGQAAILAFLIACNSRSTEPHASPLPPVSLVAGNGQSDTIQATLPKALVVQIGPGPAGQSAAHQTVQFLAVLDSGGIVQETFVEPPSGAAQPLSSLAESTDASGRVTVVVGLGIHAGPARLVVSVPAFGYVDTARFTTTPGQATGIQPHPGDTAAYVNHTVTLQSTVVDRRGNPRSGPVTYSLVSGPATLSGATATVTAYGQVLIMGSGAGFEDTTTIAGVPIGTIAASFDNAGGIVVFNLDGSGYQRISGAQAGALAWAPSGSSIAFDLNNPFGTARGAEILQSVTLSGTLSTLDTSGSDLWPAYSHDGTWIYFVKDDEAGNPALWHVHPDGRNDALVPMVSSPGVQNPSPSPNDSQIVYIAPVSGIMHILMLSSGISTGVGGVTGEVAAWSPTNNVIAYVTGQLQLATVHSDGTAQAPLGSAQDFYESEIGWSPDGQWVIARNTISGRLDIVNVTSNLVIPIPFTGGIGYPSWLPGQPVTSSIVPTRPSPKSRTGPLRPPR